MRSCYTAMAVATGLCLDAQALAAKAGMVNYIRRCQVGTVCTALAALQLLFAVPLCQKGRTSSGQSWQVQMGFGTRCWTFAASICACQL